MYVCMYTIKTYASCLVSRIKLFAFGPFILLNRVSCRELSLPERAERRPQIYCVVYVRERLWNEYMYMHIYIHA